MAADAVLDLQVFLRTGADKKGVDYLAQEKSVYVEPFVWSKGSDG